MRRARHGMLPIALFIVPAFLADLPARADESAAELSTDAAKPSHTEQTDKPADEHRKHTDYLYEPVPGDHGSHGSFDDEAKGRSPQAVLSRHRAAAAAGAAGVAAGAAAVLLRR